MSEWKTAEIQRLERKCSALLETIQRLVQEFPDGRPPKFDHLCQWCGCGDSKIEHDQDCAYVAATKARSCKL